MTALTVGSLCTGYGGLEMGLAAAGWPTRTVWHADKDPDASRLLAHHHPDVPNHGDITTVNWADVEPVDVLTGGFPCQDVSAAGLRAGIRPGTRSGLWLHIVHVINQLQPRLAVFENVGGLLNAKADRGMGPTDPYVEAAGDHALRALGCVLGDLADLGYDACWYGLAASDIGAPHRRFRVFILAWPAGQPPQFGAAVRPAAAGAGGGELNLLPTPGARLGDGRGAPDASLAARRMGEQGRRNLDDAVALLPTPRTSDRNGGGAHGDGGPDLRTSIALLPTPAARDAGRGAGWSGQPGRPLSETIHRLLPTPRARDGKGRDPNPKGFDLNEAVDQLLPTPRASNGAKGGPNQRGSSGDLALPAAVQPDRWGQYAPAIARWETILGRPAPDPTEPGRTGKPRLAPRFVEWMQSLPDGHVTAVPGLTRNAMLRLLGNGVVPMQTAAAVGFLIQAMGETS